jgi:hypothetical protein
MVMSYIKHNAVHETVRIPLVGVRRESGNTLQFKLVDTTMHCFLKQLQKQCAVMGRLIARKSLENNESTCHWWALNRLIVYSFSKLWHMGWLVTLGHNHYLCATGPAIVGATTVYITSGTNSR